MFLISALSVDTKLNNLTGVPGMNQYLVTFCLFILALVFFVIIVKFIFGIINFSRSLKYINSEIRRTHGSERRSWQRKRKKLFFKFFIYFRD